MARNLGNTRIQQAALDAPLPFIQLKLQANKGEDFSAPHSGHTVLQRSPDDKDEPASGAPQSHFPPVSGPFPPGALSATVGGLSLYDSLSPLMAGVIGSTTIDGFRTGKADLSEANKKKLIEQAKHIVEILKRYPGSEVIITGHTDAVDTEELNMALGQKRADAAAAVLKTAGVPSDVIKTKSKGESELLINTRRAEPRNRRAEVRFKAFVSPVKLPGLELTPPWQPPSPNAPGPSPGLFPPSIYPPTPSVPFGPTPTVPKPKLKNWLEEGLKRDPLLKKLPDWMRDKVVDGLKDADEKVAEKVIDSLPIGAKEKAALKAVAKSILQLLKGKKFKMPTPPPRGMDPTIPPYKFPKMPGEVIIPGPVIRF